MSLVRRLRNYFSVKHAVAYVAITASLAILDGCSKHSDASFHPYGVQHATLHFEYLGSIRGVQDIFVDSFGRREARYDHSELIDSAGFRPNYGYSFRIGSKLALIDSQQRVMRIITDNYLDSLFSLGGGYPTPDEVAASGFGQSLFHPVGDTTILGLHCKIFQQGVYPTYVYVWKGLVVGRQVIGMSHPNEQRLISIDTVTPIDPQRFVAPQGFHLIQLPPPGAAPAQ